MTFSKLSIVYVALQCTDPDWERTVTERTHNYLVATLGVSVCSVRVPSPKV